MPTITMPACEWCGRRSITVFKCRSCKKQTCNDCLRGYNSSDRCTHIEYKPVQQDNWV